MSISKNPIVVVLVVIGSILSVQGKPPSRIRGGVDAEPGHVPWTVAINYGSDPLPNCGGAIISPRHILTAGHCVVDGWQSDLIVRSGFVNIFDNSTVVRNVSNFYIHTHYATDPEFGHVMNDIAVLVLEKDLPMSNTRLIQTISLPTNQTDEPYGIVAAWGDWTQNQTINSPRNLQIAFVKILSNDLCKLLNRRMAYPQFLCGIIREGNILGGDSGGPLIGNGELIGIASSGRRIPGLPDAYVNVYHYLDWIKSIIN